MDRIAEISRLLARAGDPRLVAGFLREILTPTEVDEISSRWELVKRLHLGESQRHIAETLGLSLCKITRGSRELKKRGSALKTLLRLAGADHAPAAPRQIRSRQTRRWRS